MASNYNEGIQQLKTKEDMIDTINSLYPADSTFFGTATIGQELLREAMSHAHYNWRDMPETVLREYAKLCLQKEFDL